MTELSPIGTMSSVPYDPNATFEQRIDLKLKQGTPIYGVEMKVGADAATVRSWDEGHAGDARVRR
jgi:hypothetical protein